MSLHDSGFWARFSFPSAFSRSLLISGVLLFALAFTFAYYVRSEKRIDQAYEQRLISYLLSDELRQSSDDLTRAVRSYIVTGNPADKRRFQEILDIRNGKLPRPASVQTAWHEMSSLQAHLKLSGQAISLVDLMRQAGFTSRELGLLEQAYRNSEALAEVEQQAMGLIESADANDTRARAEARRMVFGDDYDRTKETIMKPIDDFQWIVGQRTHDAVEAAERHADRVRQLFVLFGVATLIMLWRTYQHKRKLLGASLSDVHRWISELGAGKLDVQVRVDEGDRESVAGWLAGTLAQMRETAAVNKLDQERLRMAATVFHASREAISVTDTKGIILDVNEAFLEMTGYTREEVIGKTPRLIRSDHHDASFYVKMWEEIRQKGRWRGEVWNRKKNGELYVGILSINSVLDDHGKLLRYIGLFTDITPLKQHQQKVEHIAYHDALTQLPNRTLLADRMQQALARARRFNEATAVVCLDLDGFKAVNDSLGHEAGDTLLVETAHRLTGCVRTGDTVARLGGDEFVLLLCGLNTRDDCEITLRRVLNELTIPYNLGESKQGNISGSIGYTLFPDDDADADTLLRHADHAMYAAKQAGKNRFHQFDLKQDNRTKANWGALTRIEKALEKREFRLYVQPKVSLASGEVAGGEALIRWLHPIRGLVPPSEFLPLIEDQDLALSVGDWVIEEGLRLLDAWGAQGLLMPLSVNVSARQLREKDFSTRLGAALKRFPGVKPERLEIEIVESAALDDMHKVSELIAECRAFGVRFSLDDFGTGYSSLTYLRRLAVDTLKIDQTFVRDMLDDENDLAIVRGVIGLAQAFRSHTVAEGVETWQHAARLKALGCEIAQGYAIAKPMPSEEIPGWIAGFRMDALD